MYGVPLQPQGFESSEKLGRTVRGEKSPTEKSLAILKAKLEETNRYGALLLEASTLIQKRGQRGIDIPSLLDQARKMQQIAFLNTDCLAVTFILRAKQAAENPAFDGKIDFDDEFAQRLIEKILEQTMKKKKEEESKGRNRETLESSRIRLMIEVQRYSYSLQ